MNAPSVIALPPPPANHTAAITPPTGTPTTGKPMPAYKFGDVVYYDLRGVQRVGRITYLFTTGNKGTAYHVVDDDGYYWHRNANELALYVPVPLVAATA